MTREDFAKAYPDTKCAGCKCFRPEITPCNGDFDLFETEGYCLFDDFAYHCDYAVGNKYPDLSDGFYHYHFEA